MPVTAPGARSLGLPSASPAGRTRATSAALQRTTPGQPHDVGVIDTFLLGRRDQARPQRVTAVERAVQPGRREGALHHKRDHLRGEPCVRDLPVPIDASNTGPSRISASSSQSWSAVTGQGAPRAGQEVELKRDRGAVSSSRGTYGAHRDAPTRVTSAVVAGLPRCRRATARAG
jgi:hypothetical protein